MANHFHDANGFLVIGLDGHSGIHIPFVPMWFNSINFLHPFALGGNQKTTVLFNGVNTVVNQHVTPHLWPHLGVVPDPLDLMTPLKILMGQQKTWVPRGTVLIEGSPATVCVIGGGLSIDLDCWDFGGLPTSLVFNAGTVETTPSLSDYLQGVVSVVIDVAINLVMRAVMPIIGEAVMGAVGSVVKSVMSTVTEAIENGLLSALLPEVEEEAEEEAEELADNVCTEAGHPVDVVTGAVVDRALDLTLPGTIPVLWWRKYSSRRARQRTPLGRGGWSHSYDQWVEARGDGVVLHAADGRLLRFAAPAHGAGSFHRRERLTLRRDGDGGYVVHHHAQRHDYHFVPAMPGGRAYLRTITDPFDNAVTLLYEGDRLAAVRDTAGREIRVQRSHGGRIERLEVWARGEPQQWVDYAYHPTGELARVTNALDHADTFAYDAQHRMVETTLKNGTRFYYEYEEQSGRCIRTWGDGWLHIVNLRADAQQRVVYATGGAAPRVYRWDENGAVVREETVDGALLVARTYDDDLRLLSMENGEGQATRCTYDAEGRMVSLSDPAGRTKRWEYDGEHVHRCLHSDSAVTTYERDLRGAVVGVERALPPGAEPSRLRLAIRRDERGRIASIEDAGGYLVQYEFDAEQNLASRVGAAGAKYTFAHDALGRRVEWSGPLGRVARVHRNRLGRVVSFEGPDGASSTFELDALGKLAAYTDPRGRKHCVVREGTGFVASLTYADGRVYRFQRDDDEQVRAVEDPLGDRAEVLRDGAGRRVAERVFHGAQLRYQHDRAGRVSRLRCPDGDVHSFRRDALGRVIEWRGRDAALTFERDADGRVLRATMNHGGTRSVTEVGYDAQGRRVAETQDGRTMRYVSSPRHGTIDRILPGGVTTRFLVDRSGYVLSIEQGAHRLDFARNVEGRVVELRFGPCSIQRRHDASGRLVAQRVVRDGQLVMERRYDYDRTGVVQSIDDSRWGRTEYTYDLADRLVGARRGGHHEAYAYDAGGSLTYAAGSDGATRTLQLGPGNLLLAERGVRYENDDRGRRVKRVALDEYGEPVAITRYQWDSLNRMREVVLPSGERIRHSYDAFGRRTKKERVPPGADDATQVTEYLWDGYTLAAEIVDGRLRQAYVCMAVGVPILHVEHGEVFAYVTDHVGLPQQLLDSRGVVAWEATSTAWGKVLETRRDERGPQVEPPFRLLGQVADAETGLTVTAARWFDPDLGRWLSSDPVGLAGGANLFAFAGAPTRVVDPLGLWGITCGEFQNLMDDAGAQNVGFNGISPEAELETAQKVFNEAIDAPAIVYGRLSDTTPLIGELGGGVLHDPGWTPYVEDAFEEAAMGAPAIGLQSDPFEWSNIVGKEGFATVYAEEVDYALGEGMDIMPAGQLNEQIFGPGPFGHLVPGDFGMGL
jgi:RHS repeat-associated protein